MDKERELLARTYTYINIRHYHKYNVRANSPVMRNAFDC